MDTVKTQDPQKIWEIALGHLQLMVSRPNYRTWFSRTTGLSYENNRFVIGVPNTFAAEYLEKNQRSLIEKAVRELTCPDAQVVFQVNGKYHHDEISEEKPARETTQEEDSVRLNPNYVFEAFVEGDSNRLARASALSVAQNPGRSFNPLFIYGGAGLGKTHLLHAIGHVAMASGMKIICTSAEQFTNEFVAALREKSTDIFRQRYRNIGMLLIDDIQFISGKEQTEETFFHTFNELHNASRQIVITSDRPPQEMPLLEERLRSRFEWGLLVDIQPPDYQTRLAILRQKAARSGADIPQDVLEMIASRVEGNIRSLEGSMNRVVAFARLLRARPTLDIALKALEDVGRKAPREGSLTSSAIIEAVAASFHIPPQEMIGRKKDKNIILARRLAMYLMRHETNLSVARIGQEMGHRDAASVTMACKKVAADLGNMPFLKRQLQDIRQRLQL